MNLNKLKIENPKINNKRISLKQKENFKKFFNNYKKQKFWLNWAKTPVELKYFPELKEQFNM
jgi:hypothetical protein